VTGVAGPMTTIEQSCWLALYHIESDEEAQRHGE
jgi:hypothetical protein